MKRKQNFDPIAKRHDGISFSAVFADGDILTGCLERNAQATDEEIVAGCNNGGVPVHWGIVVGIKDRQSCFYYGL